MNFVFSLNFYHQQGYNPALAYLAHQWKTMLSSAHYGLGWRIYQLGDEQLIYHGR